MMPLRHSYRYWRGGLDWNAGKFRMGLPKTPY